jgi:hypothetical protein
MQDLRWLLGIFKVNHVRYAYNFKKMAKIYAFGGAFGSSLFVNPPFENAQDDRMKIGEHFCRL